MLHGVMVPLVVFIMHAAAGELQHEQILVLSVYLAFRGSLSDLDGPRELSVLTAGAEVGRFFWRPNDGVEEFRKRKRVLHHPLRLRGLLCGATGPRSDTEAKGFGPFHRDPLHLLSLSNFEESLS